MLPSLSLTEGNDTMRIMKPSGIHTAMPIRAATVILIRDQKGRLEVYLLERSRQSDFMPGNYVFPGGVVEPEDTDFDFWKNHVDAVPGRAHDVSVEHGESLRIEDAMAHRIAAVRETFEEASILFAQPGQEANGADLEQFRRQNGQERLPGTWLRELVQSGWIVTVSALSPWSHWITPEAQKKRYDTRFLLAFMPSGQECRPDYREMTYGIWVSPEEALAGNLKRTIPLSPPALTTLHELLQYADVIDLKKDLALRSWGAPRTPRLIPLSEGPLLLLPWDPDYPHQDFIIPARELESRKVPTGQPFSRLWRQEGVWIPLSP